MGLILYKDFAKYYDKIYSFKDYKSEAKNVKALIAKHKKSKGKRLLDVACGTGKHLQYLKRSFDCTGVDLNKEMLAIARKDVKGVKFAQGNMITFDLKKRFDIITCLFSSIGHLGTKQNTARAIKNLARHLTPGGVLIIEPWVLVDQVKPNFPHLTTYEDDDFKMARLGYSRVKGRTSIIEFHYAFSERGKGLSSYEEKESMCLLTKEELMGMAKVAGLRPRYLKGGGTKRGFLLGVKP